MSKRLILNLLGEWVTAEPEAEESSQVEQGTLFDNDLPPDLERERKLAAQHRQEGGKELFPEKSQ